MRGIMSPAVMTGLILNAGGLVAGRSSVSHDLGGDAPQQRERGRDVAEDSPGHR